MSDNELQQARRVMLSYRAPGHRGCSLTAKLCFGGDPVWGAGVAPALHWAHIVWLAVTAPVTSHYNVKQICQMWRAVPFNSQVCWRSSSGPMQRMHLSLFRVGWCAASALTWEDDYGREIHLAYTSPPMVAHLLMLATQRGHGRKLAARSPSFTGAR
eukprot:8779700-Pyramimonas_sp.AAC.1